MLTIYNTTVPVKDQDQADRLKQICIDYGLPIWDDKDAFKFLYVFENSNFFCFEEKDKEFFILSDNRYNKTEITEQQFIELLKDTRL